MFGCPFDEATTLIRGLHIAWCADRCLREPLEVYQILAQSRTYGCAGVVWPRKAFWSKNVCVRSRAVRAASSAEMRP